MKITPEMTKLAWRAYDDAKRGPVDRIDAVFEVLAPMILEEAAKAAENERLENEPYNHEDGAYNAAVEHIAEAIRALAENKTGPEMATKATE